MERILGIGGVFFKARDPKALAAWYREHLGVPVEVGQTYGALASALPVNKRSGPLSPRTPPISALARPPSWSITGCETSMPCWPNSERPERK